MAASVEARLERNVALYGVYVAARDALFWMPVFFLYFSSRLPLDRVLQLEAIYYAAVVVMEVPSGYFSDRVGRRATLLISSSMLLLAYVLFLLDGGFAVFAAAQGLLAAGFAFNSGTDTAFHHDSLALLGRASEYDRREARAARLSFIAGACAALLGGAAATIDLRLAYLLSAVAALVGVGVLVACIEPADHEPAEAGKPQRFVAQLVRCVGYLGRPRLAWLFAFAVLMVALNHVPYEFYQPYLALLMADTDAAARFTPLTTGAHMAATMLIGSYFAGWSVAWRDRVGLGAALLSAAALQLLIIAAMAAVLSPLVAALAVLRTAPRALMTAPLNAAIVPRLEKQHRATYLSIQNLTGRLAFAALLAGLSVGVAAEIDWAALSRMLMSGAAIGALAAAALLLSVGVLRHDD